MGFHLLKSISASVSENAPIVFPAVVGFVFLLAAILLFKKEELLYGIVFLASALILFAASRHHYLKKGTPDYGKTITPEPWGVMPAWKKWATIAGIILFLLLWLYLVILGISGGVHLGNICIGSC